MSPTEAERAAQLATRVTFGIVAALPEERAAILAMLDAPVPYAASGKGVGLTYDLGEIQAFGGGTHVVAVALAGVGNNVAAARGTLLLRARGQGSSWPFALARRWRRTG
jgi:nucleoside phosphorylase